VQATVVRGRRAEKLVAAIATARGLLDAHVIAREVVLGHHAAGRLHDLAVIVGEVAEVEVVVALFREPFERVRGALLVEHLARVEQRSLGVPDLATLVAGPDHVSHREGLAPHERVDLEPVAGVGDGGCAQFLRRLGAVRLA